MSVIDLQQEEELRSLVQLAREETCLVGSVGLGLGFVGRSRQLHRRRIWALQGNVKSA